MIEYFGTLDEELDFEYWGPFAYRNYTPYTCPGTGSQKVVNLSVWAKTRSAPHGNIRLALYDSGGNLVIQGAAEVLVDSADAAWVGHDFDGSVTITGGSSYYIGFTEDSLLTFIHCAYPGGTQCYGDYVDYTGGFPDPWDISATETLLISVRCGVEAVGGNIGKTSPLPLFFRAT